jgi:hypothetical protein
MLLTFYRLLKSRNPTVAIEPTKITVFKYRALLVGLAGGFMISVRSIGFSQLFLIPFMCPRPTTPTTRAGSTPKMQKKG